MIDHYAALLRQTARVYRESLAAPDTDDMFSLAYQWQDKKHRHVWDLCKELEQAADRIEKLEALIEKLRDDNSFLIDSFDKDFLRQDSRIKKLEAALREIGDCCTLPAQNDFEMREIACKALEGKDD
jgi:hypothetical protein